MSNFSPVQIESIYYRLYVPQNIKFVFQRVENIAGKGENAVNQHFLLFPQWFQKEFSSGASEAVTIW